MYVYSKMEREIQTMRNFFLEKFQSAAMRKPIQTSYLTSIDIFSLSRTVFEIFDFKVLRV